MRGVDFSATTQIQIWWILCLPYVDRLSTNTTAHHKLNLHPLSKTFNHATQEHKIEGEEPHANATRQNKVNKNNKGPDISDVPPREEVIVEVEEQKVTSAGSSTQVREIVQLRGCMKPRTASATVNVDCIGDLHSWLSTLMEQDRTLDEVTEDEDLRAKID